MGGDSGPKRLYSVVNKMVDCLKMDKESLKKEILESDEQAKMRAVNADPENRKELKLYRAEGRIVEDQVMAKNLIKSILNIANQKKQVVMNDLFKPLSLARTEEIQET